MRRKSCRSRGERDIKLFLEDNNISFLQECIFKECVNPSTNRPLRYDFYLPLYNLIIEYQGKHHYEPINKYWRAKKVHASTVEHDLIKKEFCLQHHINLLTIPYWDYKKIIDIILQKLNELVNPNMQL